MQEKMVATESSHKLFFYASDYSEIKRLKYCEALLPLSDVELKKVEQSPQQPERCLCLILYRHVQESSILLCSV
uniref:Uncharacterized protein n=1 Tax=Romanomermis culicivorax TaxID=13658 RepID=A0A915HLD5_ROMCU